MDTLVISLNNVTGGQSWQAKVMNPVGDGKCYDFAGETLDDQLLSVNYLSSSMSCGTQEVTQKLSQLIDLDGDSVETAVTALFQETDDLDFSAQIIYSVPEAGAVLWDFIEDAGVALMGALG